jgi:hypothetical protein
MLLLLALQVAPDLDDALVRYRERTKVSIECRAERPDDIVICSRRDADRYRVPFNTIDPNDPKNQTVAAERDRLLARTSNCQEKSTFLVGCGKVGVGVSTARGVTLGGERPLAP